VVLEPTPADLSIWLPRILGGAANGTSYTQAETLPVFVAAVDKIAKVHNYTGCKVDRATFSGSKGAPVRLSLDIEGLTETTANAGTFPSLDITEGAPYVLSDLTVTIGTTTREVESFTLAFDNALIKDRFMNQTTRVNLPESDRNVTLALTLAYASENTDLHELAVAGANGSLVLASGNASTTFTFVTLQKPEDGPEVPAKNQEIPLTVNLTARSSGSTAEVTVTHTTGA
jgi:hypothetical protein